MFLPYILPIILGRTFDYNDQKPGVDIFTPGNVTANTKMINRYVSDARYRMVQSNQDVADLLDVRGELNLKVMAGAVDIEGAGSYLKDTSDKKSKVEILTRVKFETVTETLHQDIVPKPGWHKMTAEVLGSHYVSSITYGGELVASLTFTALEGKDIKEIRAKVKESIGADAIAKVSGGGQYTKLAKDLKDSAKLEIKYYATANVEGIATDVESFERLVKDFPSHVNKSTNGKGNPIRMSITPLSSLMTGSNRIHFLRNGAIDNILGDVTNKFEDVMRTYSDLQDFASTLNYTDETKKLVGEFYGTLVGIKQVFQEAIMTLDMSSVGKPSQFDAAFAAYQGSERLVYPSMYQDKLQQLKKTVEKLEKSAEGIKPCVPQDVPDPCSNANYVMMPSSDRLMNAKTDMKNVLSDSKLDTRWYRFENARMAMTCPPINTCGSRFPIWMADPLPPRDGVIHKRQACIHTTFNCDVTCLDIMVKQCRNYVVYKLEKIDFMTGAAYCTTPGS